MLSIFVRRMSLEVVMDAPNGSCGRGKEVAELRKTSAVFSELLSLNCLSLFKLTDIRVMKYGSSSISLATVRGVLL